MELEHLAEKRGGQKERERVLPKLEKVVRRIKN